MIRTVRAHLSYANVMASIAVFVALGGTSYALTQLPRDSVGSKQIRSKAVGASELRPATLRSRHIHNGSITLNDLSARTKRALRGATGSPGPTGPAGPPAAAFSTAVNVIGVVTSGDGVVNHPNGGSGLYGVRYDRDMTSCRAVATLSRVQGANPVLAPNGEITTDTTTEGVVVRTFNSQGQPTDLPFHLIVVC